MNNYNHLLIIILLMMIAGCNSTGVIREDKTTQFIEERIAIKHYLNGEYELAFEPLSNGALRGYKESQYFLAFMFFKGQHVKQSTVLGMAWLGVAIESGRKDWEEQYKAFYEAASPELKARIDHKVQEYITKFGMKAQNVTCSELTSPDSARPKIRCNKGSRVSPLYELELIEGYSETAMKL